jgi:hypothetical protein
MLAVLYYKMSRTAGIPEISANPGFETDNVGHPLPETNSMGVQFDPAAFTICAPGIMIPSPVGSPKARKKYA